MPPPRKPAIALLSDRALFRQGLAELLTEQGLIPILELDDVTKLLAGAQRRPIDIAIIDLDQSADINVIVNALRADLPEMQLLVLGTPMRQPAVDAMGAETPEVDREALVTALVHGFRAAAADKPP